MAESKLPELIAGRYRPISEIGRGGMGSVLLVEHVNTGDRLALKMLHKSFGGDKDLVERFKREARAAAKIKSEHVVRITDADIAEELDGMPFMVMEVLNGEDLLRRMRARKGVFSKEEVVGILSQVARALDRAHAIGVVHRDIKPENIFLHTKEDGTEIVKILDFGISKVIGEIDQHATAVGTLLGTPSFMAPEQVRTGPISPQTDMWAVGMVTFRLLTGKSYWPKVSTGELMAHVLAHPMDVPSARAEAAHLGAAFDAWFMKSCDRNPSGRWSTVTEQVNALASALQLAGARPMQLGAPIPSMVPPSFTAVLPPSPPSHGVVESVTGDPTATSKTLAQQPNARHLAIGFVVGAGLLVVVFSFVALYLVHVRSNASLVATPQDSTLITVAPASASSIGMPTPSASAPIAEATASAAPSATAVAAPPPQSTARPRSSNEPKKASHAVPTKSEDPWAR